MHAFVYPAIPEDLVGPFSIGAQPLALLMFRNLAVEAGHDDVRLIDEALHRFDTSTLGRADRVFVSVNFLNLARAREIIDESLARGAAVVLGGPALEAVCGNIEQLGLACHPRLTPVAGGWKRVMAAMAVLLGCAEPWDSGSWDKLARLQSDRASEEDVSSASAIYRERSGLQFAGHLGNLHSRIGCLYRSRTGGCRFCSRHSESYSCMRPSTLVELARALVERWGAGLIWDTSDSFFEAAQDLQRLSRLGLGRLDARLLVFARVDVISSETAALLRECGVRYAVLGLESGSDRLLRIARKGITVEQGFRAVCELTQAGISSIPCFTIGHPTECEADVEQTERLAERLVAECDIAAISCSPIVPMLGSDYYRMSGCGSLGIAPWRLRDIQEVYFRSHAMLPLAYAHRTAAHIEAMRGHPIAIWGRGHG